MSKRKRETEEKETNDVDHALAERVARPDWYLSMRHAQDHNCNRAVWALDAVRNHTFSCPDCHKSVILKRGTERVAHFAHRMATDGNVCDRYSAPRMSESHLHREAKLLLAEWIRRGHSISFGRECGRCARQGAVNYDLKNCTAAIEYRGPENSYIADIAVLSGVGNAAHSIRFIIEICHTHATSRARPEPWHEVDAESVCNALLQNWDTRLLEIKDIRQYPITTKCTSHNCLTLSALAEQLGYLEWKEEADHWEMDPVSWIRHTCMGRIQKRGEWRLEPSSSSSNPNTWQEFIRRKQCLRCARTVAEAQMLRPFCTKCFRMLKKQHVVFKSDELQPLSPMELYHRGRFLKHLDRLPRLDAAKLKSSCLCLVCLKPLSKRVLFYFGERLLCQNVECIRTAVRNQVPTKHILDYLAQESVNEEKQSVAEPSGNSKEKSKYFSNDHDDDDSDRIPAGVKSFLLRRKRSKMDTHFITPKQTMNNEQ